jgi:hypothetical protein
MQLVATSYGWYTSFNRLLLNVQWYSALYEGVLRDLDNPRQNQQS